MGINSALHIIIFDELDAICRQRGSLVRERGGRGEREKEREGEGEGEKGREGKRRREWVYMYLHLSPQTGSTGVHDTVVNQLLAKVSTDVHMCNAHTCTFMYTCEYIEYCAVDMCMIKSMRPIQYKARQHNNTT